MTLAATAIPVELRFRDQMAIGFGINASDVVTNIAGYVLVGAVLGPRLLRAVSIATLIAAFAESAQLFMMHRDPSVVDIASNATGAIFGAVLSRYSANGAPIIGLNRRRASAAAGLALGIVFSVWLMSAEALNRRGSTAPGTLEAHWKLDTNAGRIATDSSGHELHGTFSRAPKLIAGPRDGAVEFDGSTDFIDFGRSSAFRLVGSMTITAWFKSTSYPADDAAIVSSMANLVGIPSSGFQLDTTIDRGPRTLGFKVTDECGHVAARYGATPLVIDTWYHAAGIYDAQARKMDVYLNGELDNGFLLGSIGSTHRSSRQPVYIGRRSDLRGFEFAGAIDDVRVYSRALTKEELGSVMRGTYESPAGRTRESVDIHHTGNRISADQTTCGWQSERQDARLPGVVATLGVFIALACMGLQPTSGAIVSVLVAPLAGLIMSLVASPTLPSLNMWLFPLTCLAGSVSVVLSTRASQGH